MPDISRRTVARGAIWSVPVLAVAASAPAVAASCVPTTVSKTVALQWVSTLLDYSSSDGSESPAGSDIRRIRYTFTNEGPDDVPARVEAKLSYTITVDSSDWTASCEVVATSTNATASLTSSGPEADADGHLTYHYEITVASTQDILKDETLTIDVRVMYGYLAGASGDLGHPEESVTVKPLQSVTDSTGCVTSVVSASVDGGDDVTTWGYPIS